jgi:hypothetical protein
VALSFGGLAMMALQFALTARFRAGLDSPAAVRGVACQEKHPITLTAMAKWR